MPLTLQDRADITDLHARYGFAIDFRKWDQLHRVFSPDAVIHFDGSAEHRGIDAILKFFRSTATSASATQHLMHTSMAWLDNDGQVHGRVHVTAHHTAVGAEFPAATESTFTVTGTYTDRYERHDGECKIAYRRLSLMTSIGDSSILTVH